MNRRLINLKVLWLIILSIFLSGLLYINLGVLSVRAEVLSLGEDPVLEEFEDFTVGIFDYEIGTVEYKLSELILSDLRSSNFRTEKINTNSSVLSQLI